ncbi:MAG TPA: squalene--hopene cyclase [Gaiellaceae bacterium]|nr:squalene--hopene cyclase [Gaiellaceae bacterium]
MTVTLSARVDAARLALQRGRDYLLSLQHPDGYWKGELETNVTIDSEDLFLRFYLDILEPGATEATARWIRSKQRPDGSWATFFGGPADVSTTVEAYVALRLAGDDPAAEHMQRAAAAARAGGGLEATRVFTRMWLALLGLWSWHEVPVVPPEQILLPPRAPLSVYTFGCWARQTIVALSICCALRPSRRAGFDVDELRSGVTPPVRRSLFTLLDRLLHFHERHPIRPLRRRALDAAERWVVERQERDGSWGGIQPPWVWSIVALHARGYPLDHPVLKLALDGLDTFTIEDAAGRRLEACQSPVWDTALAVIALLDAGLPPDHDAIVRAARWLEGREVRVRGDWAVRRPELEPGGFPFEFANDNYPDVDDTAVVVLALRRAGAADGACRRGLAWAIGMQSSDGGWAAFDADNTSRLGMRLPFFDFGAVTDPPSADVTAHMVELLAVEGIPAREAVDWLLRAQEPDGSWFGRWGANYVYGVGAVVPALAAAGLAGHESVRRAVSWLERVQNADGGFGEDLRSYREPEWRARGASTASQTAWALLALDAAGARGEAFGRAVAWLAATQRPDGSWDEPYFTGTGFPGDFYLNYHLYRQVFPVMALGRALR